MHSVVVAFGQTSSLCPPPAPACPFPKWFDTRVALTQAGGCSGWWVLPCSQDVGPRPLHAVWTLCSAIKGSPGPSDSTVAWHPEAAWHPGVCLQARAKLQLKSLAMLPFTLYPWMIYSCFDFTGLKISRTKEPCARQARWNIFDGFEWRQSQSSGTENQPRVWSGIV